MPRQQTEYQNINFRMEKSVKKELDEVLNEIGLNTSITFNMIARLIIRERGIPFPLTIKNDDTSIKETRQLLTEIRKEARENGTSDLTMDEINDEIALFRKEKRESKGMEK